MAVASREQMREALRKKTEEDFEHGGESTMFGDIFEEVDGLQKWKCGKGVHQGDIIPYRAGNQDPKTKEGELTFVLHIWVHQRVGPNQETFVCPTANYKLPCPICEHREQVRAQEDYDEDFVKSLFPKHRNVYNWWCFDNEKEEAKGVQVWEVADFFMGEKLRSISKMPDRSGKGGGYIHYADPDVGKTIKFERKGEGKENTQFLGHQFVDRNYIIPDEILEQAKVLDQIIHIPTYEEIKEAFFLGEKEEEDPFAEQPQEEPQPLAGAPTPLRRAIHTEEPETNPPAPRTPLRTGGPRATNECPQGGIFGKDIESFQECNECIVYDKCYAEHEKLVAKEPPKPPPQPSGRGAVRGTGKPPEPPKQPTGKPALLPRRGMGGKK